MKPLVYAFLIAAAIILGIVIYKSRASGGRLHVTPDAAREIEKAKRR
ncbi:MAG: hypothetical protein ABI165_02115 [Bryobacteraceae bacterium]